MILAFHEGDYLTDQRRLYRVLQVVPRRLRRRAAVLEDCHTLEAILYGPRELKALQLQVVRPDPPPRRSSRRRASVIDSSPTSSAPWTVGTRRTSV
jgi:hypothetical protein